MDGAVRRLCEEPSASPSNPAAAASSAPAASAVAPDDHSPLALPDSMRAAITASREAAERAARERRAGQPDDDAECWEDEAGDIPAKDPALYAPAMSGAGSVKAQGEARDLMATPGGRVRRKSFAEAKARLSGIMRGSGTATGGIEPGSASCQAEGQGGPVLGASHKRHKSVESAGSMHPQKPTAEFASALQQQRKRRRSIGDLRSGDSHSNTSPWEQENHLGQVGQLGTPRGKVNRRSSSRKSLSLLQGSSGRSNGGTGRLSLLLLPSHRKAEADRTAARTRGGEDVEGEGEEDEEEEVVISLEACSEMYHTEILMALVEEACRRARERIVHAPLHAKVKRDLMEVLQLFFVKARMRIRAFCDPPPSLHMPIEAAHAIAAVAEAEAAIEMETAAWERIAAMGDAELAGLVDPVLAPVAVALAPATDFPSGSDVKRTQQDSVRSCSSGGVEDKDSKEVDEPVKNSLGSATCSDRGRSGGGAAAAPDGGRGGDGCAEVCVERSGEDLDRACAVDGAVAFDDLDDALRRVYDFLHPKVHVVAGLAESCQQLSAEARAVCKAMVTVLEAGEHHSGTARGVVHNTAHGADPSGPLTPHTLFSQLANNV